MRRDVGVARDLEQRQLRRVGRPRVQRRFARPRQVRRADVHPAVRDVHARHVHAVARRARALHGIAEADAVQVHRVADEERAEHEDVVAARDRGAPFLLRARRRRCRRLRPRVAERKDLARRVVAEHAGRRRGEIARAEARRAVRQLAGRGDRAPAPRRSAPRTRRCARSVGRVKPRGSPRCVRAASAACAFSVVTRASAIMFMLVGKPVSGSRTAGKPLFAMNGPTPKLLCVRYFVFATRRGRRYTDTVGCADVQAVDGVRVAARRIADDLERELDGQRRAGRIARRPRQRDADQAARQQQRVRGGIAFGQDAGSCGRRWRRTAGPGPPSRPSARARSRRTAPWRRRAGGRSRRRGRSCRAARRTGGRAYRSCRPCSGCRARRWRSRRTPRRAAAGRRRAPTTRRPRRRPRARQPTLRARAR